MGGIPMVSILPFIPPKSNNHRNIYCCKYCKELYLAQNIQRSSSAWEIIGMIVAILSVAAMAHYVMTGSESALAAWLFFSALIWIF
jgi:hypothetical protein